MSSEKVATLKVGEFAQVKGGKRMPAGTALTSLITNHPYLRIVDFRYGTIDVSNLQYVPNEVFPKISRYIISAEDLYISIVGTVGLVGSVPRCLNGANLTENAAKICHIDPARIDQRYLGYFLRSELGQDAIRALTVGSTQPKLALFRIEQIEVPCPSLHVQKGIADILSALDDRITLLRETNATLEAIAQALFKSWFVDFDPVRAKMEGRVPEGMDEATAALFPDSFEETELGEVPKGWRAGLLSNLIRLHKGSVNPGVMPDIEFQHFSLPSFDVGQMPVTERGSEIKSNKTTVPVDAVLLSKLNPHIPRIWLPSSIGGNAVCSTEFLPFVPFGSATTAFVYCLLAAPDFIKTLTQLVTGTSNSHQRIKPDGVLSLVSVIPSAAVISAFDTVTTSLLDRLKANREEANTLANLRDSLLPRLISGQLKIVV